MISIAGRAGSRRLTGDDDSLQLALIPFVKLPNAATGLGNGEVEGGLGLPISPSLTGPVTLTLGPELDLLADSDGAGHHLNLVSLINVSAQDWSRSIRCFRRSTFSRPARRASATTS